MDQGEEIFISGSSQLGECNNYDINDDQGLEICKNFCLSCSFLKILHENIFFLAMTIYHQGFDAVRLDFVNVTVTENGSYETVQCDVDNWLNNGEYISVNDCY